MKAVLIRHDKVTDEQGNTVEIKLWKIPPTPDKPKGYKYSLAYIVDGKRVIGYDNSEQKGDHRHHESLEVPYAFSSLRQLAEDFMADVQRFKRSR